MKRTRILFMALALLSALVLAACGESPAVESQPTQATGAQPTAAGDQLAATQQPAAGDGVLDQIKSRGRLIVGTSADYPPYESVDESGNFTGFDIEIIREIGSRMGVEVEIQDMAFDALIVSLQEGKIDAIIAAMQATPERDEQVDFTDPYHHPKDAFLIAQGSEIGINSPQDIANLNVGVQTGTAQERWIRANLIDTGLMNEDQLFSYERADQAALDLAAGRIDVLMIIGEPARELAAQQGLTIALETDETIAAGQAIAIPNGAADLKAEMDRILQELENEGFITQLREKYNIP